MSKHLRKIKCKKRFFLNYFLSSLVLMLLVCVLWMFLRHGMYNLISNFYDVTFKEFNAHALCLMSLWKLLIIQFTLAPAVAFMLTEKYVKEQNIDEYDDEYGNRMV